MVLQQGLAGIHQVFIAPRAANVLANRFGDDLVIVRFNIRKSGDATIEALASSLSGRGTSTPSTLAVLKLMRSSNLAAFRC